MNPENDIWMHLANKLANEATENEVRELDELLLLKPDILERTSIVFEWWQSGQVQNDDRIFKKILERIKEG